MNQYPPPQKMASISSLIAFSFSSFLLYRPGHAAIGHWTPKYEGFKTFMGSGFWLSSWDEKRYKGKNTNLRSRRGLDFYNEHAARTWATNVEHYYGTVSLLEAYCDIIGQNITMYVEEAEPWRAFVTIQQRIHRQQKPATEDEYNANNKLGYKPPPNLDKNAYKYDSTREEEKVFQDEEGHYIFPAGGFVSEDAAKCFPKQFMYSPKGDGEIFPVFLGNKNRKTTPYQVMPR